MKRQTRIDRLNRRYQKNQDFRDYVDLIVEEEKRTPDILDQVQDVLYFAKVIIRINEKKRKRDKNEANI